MVGTWYFKTSAVLNLIKSFFIALCDQAIDKFQTWKQVESSFTRSLKQFSKSIVGTCTKKVPQFFYESIKTHV